MTQSGNINDMIDASRRKSNRSYAPFSVPAMVQIDRLIVELRGRDVHPLVISEAIKAATKPLTTPALRTFDDHGGTPDPQFESPRPSGHNAPAGDPRTMSNEDLGRFDAELSDLEQSLTKRGEGWFGGKS